MISWSASRVSIVFLPLLFACSTEAPLTGDAGELDLASAPDFGHSVDAATDLGRVVDAGRDASAAQGATCPTGVCNLVTNAGCGFGRCEISFGEDNPANPPYTSCGLYAGARNLGEGAACTSTELDCAPGLACAGALGCVHMCCNGADSDCPDGQQCILEFRVLGADVGLGGCAVPAS